MSKRKGVSVPTVRLDLTAPVLGIEEFQGVSGISRIEFAGFRAWVNVTRRNKQQTQESWRALYAEYQGHC